jgi:hypothetical protein
MPTPSGAPAAAGPAPASTWKSEGSCPVGCKEPICVDSNCTDDIIGEKSWKACSGTCGNYNNEPGCKYDSQCTAEKCGKKFFAVDDNTPCKENKKWNNASGNNAPSISGGVGGNPPQIPSGVPGATDTRPLSTEAPIQPSGAGDTPWIGSPGTKDVPQSQPAPPKPKDNSLFNKQIMTQVLANKNLIPSDIDISLESQGNFLRIGKNFMSDVSHIRNVVLPNIDNHDYESLGRVIAKIKLEQKTKTQGPHQQVMTKQLVNSINNILAGTQLTSSQVDWRAPKQAIKVRTTGMFGDDSNALIGKGEKAVKHHKDSDGGLCLWEGCDKSKNRPYDSVWSLY